MLGQPQGFCLSLRSTRKCANVPCPFLTGHSMNWHFPVKEQKQVRLFLCVRVSWLVFCEAASSSSSCEQGKLDSGSLARFPSRGAQTETPPVRQPLFTRVAMATRGPAWPGKAGNSWESFHGNSPPQVREGPEGFASLRAVPKLLK